MKLIPYNLKMHSMRKIFPAVLLLMANHFAANAQDAAASTSSVSTNSMFLVVIGLMAVVLFFQAVVIRRLTAYVNEQQYRITHGKEMPAEERTVTSAKKSDDVFTRLFKTLTRSNRTGKEKDVMLDHNYDGIHELDNIMPPWLQMILYTSIIFAFVYLLVYHVYDLGKLPQDEYKQELMVAQQQQEERLKLVGASVDESSVKQLTDQASLSIGQTTFLGRCSACHGQKAEGAVGPNLTDNYWLHGGSVNDIFKTVKYGVPAKGMVPWQGVLKPEEMQDVVSYVMSIHGSNPPNAKEPQGVLYTPPAATTDSTSTAAVDSTKAKG